MSDNYYGSGFSVDREAFRELLLTFTEKSGGSFGAEFWTSERILKLMDSIPKDLNPSEYLRYYAFETYAVRLSAPGVWLRCMCCPCRLTFDPVQMCLDRFQTSASRPGGALLLHLEDLTAPVFVLGVCKDCADRGQAFVQAGVTPVLNQIWPGLRIIPEHMVMPEGGRA